MKSKQSAGVSRYTANKEKRLKEKLLAALEQSLGIVLYACKKAGIGRTTHYKWLKEDEDYRQKVEAIEDSSIDFAEAKLLENVKNNDVASIIFYLKCKGKKRGFVERQEIVVPDTIEVDFSK